MFILFYFILLELNHNFVTQNWKHEYFLIFLNLQKISTARYIKECRK